MSHGTRGIVFAHPNELPGDKWGLRWSSGRASVEGTGVQNHLLPFQNLGNFVHPTFPVSFGRDTQSRWSFLPGDYARGSKKSHTGTQRVVVSISNPGPDYRRVRGAEQDLQRS